MLRKGSHSRSHDSAQNVQPECHFLADVGMNGGTHCEMQTDLVTERVNLTYLTDDFAPERIVELAVDQHEERRSHASLMLQFGHLQRVTRRKVDVVAERNVAPWPRWATRQKILEA